MKPLRHGSLFSGIGAAEIAAEMLGWENVFHCEINPFGRQVLEYWFPNSDSYEDITKTDFTQYRGQIDVLTGGFPCQPFSYAGKRGGKEDDRYLWHEMLRVIDQVRPMWVIGENVNGITTMVESIEVAEVGSESSLFDKADRVHRFRSDQTFTIERICRDLESKGYSVQPMLIPACSVGAPHRRDRIFILAYNVADSDCGNDLRESGEYESNGSEKRLSERNEVWKPRESNHVRSSSERPASDSDGSAGRSKETECGGQECLPSRQEGRSIFCDSERLGASWDASDTQCKRLQERMPSGIGEDTKEGRAGMDNRTERLGNNGDASDSDCARSQRRDNCDKEGYRQTEGGSARFVCGDKMLPGNRWQGFPSVSPVHRGNDGLPFDVDNLTISFSKWRTESLKAYGNAIVPQVIYQIMRCINSIEDKKLL